MRVEKYYLALFSIVRMFEFFVKLADSVKATV